MRKPLLALTIALLAMPLATPLIVSEANALPKCRNVAGYEPKPTCEARNQRAQWQAEQTARMTAQLVADALAQHSPDTTNYLPWFRQSFAAVVTKN